MRQFFLHTPCTFKQEFVHALCTFKHFLTFKRLSRRFDIGVRLRVKLGGGVSSVIVNPDINRCWSDLSSLAGLLLVSVLLLLIVSVSRRLSRSSDIGVSLLVRLGGGRSCSVSVFAFFSHLEFALLILLFFWHLLPPGIFMFCFFCLFCFLQMLPPGHLAAGSFTKGHILTKQVKLGNLLARVQPRCLCLLSLHLRAGMSYIKPYSSNWLVSFSVG